MFGNNKKKENTQNNVSTSTPNAHGLNSLVKGTTVEGSITSDSDVRIDGTIKGTLNCKAKVIIGPSGYVDGEITCENALIEGRFTGKIRVNGLLTVRETADVNGDIKTIKLQVDPGAQFNVTCDMGNHSSTGNRASETGKTLKKGAN